VANSIRLAPVEMPPAPPPAGSWGTPPIWAARTTVSRRCDGTMNKVLTKAVLLAAAPEVVSRPNRNATPASRAPVPVAVPGLAGERGDLEGRDRGLPGVAGLEIAPPQVGLVSGGSAPPHSRTATDPGP
jgi:hypothetical protein